LLNQLPPAHFALIRRKNRQGKKLFIFMLLMLRAYFNVSNAEASMRLVAAARGAQSEPGSF
jgi:hypothetical protein